MDVLFFHRGQQFIWDAEKALSNLAKHGIRFQTACEVFFDPFVRETDANVNEEVRDAAIGVDEDWIRIISAREATAKERRLYENSD